MDFGLSGKTALVTGASRGIGLAIARALLGEGVSVVMVARAADRLNLAANELRASLADTSPVAVHPVTGDLGVREEIARIAETALARLGHIDILVNNAASSHTGSFFQLSDHDLVEAWQVKALGYMRLIRAVAPAMIARRTGSIVNIIGDAARTPALDFVHGSMVNAALVNFTRGISRELAHSNVRINAISPGWTKTERQQESFEREARQRQLSVEVVEAEHARTIPLNRLVSLEEIATLTLLLVSNRLPAMTGEDLVVDGGATPSL
jgi:3-oxoacyl-[acyl-carrier protein] reductase/bacilysin biosynthesis oxidoreductase BacG